MSGKRQPSGVTPFLPYMAGRVMDIWLRANREAHAFVPGAFWEERLVEVRGQIAHADVWVFVEDGEVQGFCGVVDGYVAGLFVAPEAQGRGIGTALMNRCKERYDRLELDVYLENPGAAIFYRRCGFTEQGGGTNADTGHEELHMVWERK